MTRLLQDLINGLSAGSLYALLAVGIVLIYKSSEVLNFAHGSFAMLSTFVAYHLATRLGLSLPLAMASALVSAFLLGALAYRGLLYRARQGGPHAVVMVTIGCLMVVEGAAGVIWGTDVKEFHHFFAEPRSIALGADVRLGVHDAWIIGAAVATAVLLAVFFRFTRAGIALRAVQQNELAAELMGVRVARVHALTWGIATLLGAMAGLLVVPKLLLDPAMMFSPLLKAFAAAVLGGMSSVAGAIIGGWLLGMTEALAGAYVSTEFQATIAFMIIVVVLVLRPEGLLGSHRQKKV
ncbi:MAG: branched-chain amino acid ABC transporter permease [Polyangiaceae bacterium]|nr:branched-chain amino acid ABC transporter permease [Polyangiaceae bacterium]